MKEPRHALVAHIREQIEAGNYDTKSKVSVVASKIMQELRSTAWVPPGYKPLPHSAECTCWGCMHWVGQCGEHLCKHPSCLAKREDS